METKPQPPPTRDASLARNLYRRLIILGAGTVVMMAMLALAPAKSYFSEWRAIQTEYNEKAVAAGQPPMEVRIKQIWRKEIGLTDRCTTCHVGKGAATPLPSGGPLYGAHPEVHHDVSRMGCTLCHQGQGRATTIEDAHGNVKHWDEPMLPMHLLQSACGTCHGPSLRVPPAQAAERGEYLFSLHGCQACHRVEGRGGDVGPDLSGVALKGYSREWHIQHLREPARAVEGSRMMSFGHLRDEEIDALLGYLDTLIGAPVLVRGKSLARQAGCRGCHVIEGVGGEHGPSLADSASKLGVDRDFAGVEGEPTNENWQRQHLRNPSKVSPGSKMPAFVLSEADETALVTYILSLRRTELPMEELPKATILAGFSDAQRDYDPKDGASVFQTYCSACHGPEGLGQVMPSLDRTVPAIANAGALAMASDEFLRASIVHGRPDRDMPAWGGPKGLSDVELEAVIAWLRAKQPRRPSWSAVEAALETGPDKVAGAALFAYECSGCHGSAGEGTVLATGLANAELAVVATDEFLYETISGGRANTAMPAHPEFSAQQLANVIAWLRREDVVGPVALDGAERTEGETARRALAERLFVDTLTSYRATGSAAYGKTLYDGLCVGCHGVDAQGGIGSAIGNPAFLRVASDGFIAGSILLGRGQRAMRSFDAGGLVTLKARDIGDLITYLRDVGSHERDKQGVARVQGSQPRGKVLFDAMCTGCHGIDGAGDSGPALRDPQFLDAASDGFLQATIARGRSGTGMRAWARGGFGFAELSPREINDIVSYVRSWQPRESL